MNNYEFKTEGQNVYLRPNSRCEWRLLCVAFDYDSAKMIERSLWDSTTDFSLTYQFQSSSLIHPTTA